MIFSSRRALPQVRVEFCVEQIQRTGFMPSESVQRTVVCVITTVSTILVTALLAVIRFDVLVYKELPSGDGRSCSMFHL